MKLYKNILYAGNSYVAVRTDDVSSCSFQYWVSPLPLHVHLRHYWNVAVSPRTKDCWHWQSAELRNISKCFSCFVWSKSPFRYFSCFLLVVLIATSANISDALSLGLQNLCFDFPYRRTFDLVLGFDFRKLGSLHWTNTKRRRAVLWCSPSRRVT